MQVARGPWLAAALGAASCAQAPCDRLYELEQKCADPARFPAREDFIGACKLAREGDHARAEIDAVLGCADQDSCDGFRACSEAQRAKLRARAVERLVAAGAWHDAFDDCTLRAGHYADPGFAAACKQLLAELPARLRGGELADAMLRCRSSRDIARAVPELDRACAAMASAQLAGARDALRAERDAGRRGTQACFALRQLAEVAGGEALLEARAQCDESAVAEEARQAIEAARASAATDAPELPAGCALIDGLHALGTAWAQRTADDVVKACYVELGAAIVARERDSKTAKYRCPPKIAKVQDAAAKYDLAARYPELAAALAAVPKKCK